MLDLIEEARILQGDPYIRRNCGEKMPVVFREDALLCCTLNTHHTDGFPANKNRNAKIRQRRLAHLCRPQLFALAL